jgi:hypothetical protein
MGDIDPTNDPTRVVDATPFPDPSLYFKVGWWLVGAAGVC